MNRTDALNRAYTEMARTPTVATARRSSRPIDLILLMFVTTIVLAVAIGGLLTA